MKQLVLALLLTSAVFVMTSRIGFFGYRSYTVLTGSMRPSIPPGSIVIVHPKSSYQVGDVITFGANGTVVTHRIQSATKRMQFVTKGDSNRYSDTHAVSWKDIVGSVKTVIPYVGYLTQFARTLPGFIGLVIAPSVILIALEFRTIYMELRRSIERNYEEKYSTALPE